jgi:hypothetical protein
MSCKESSLSLSLSPQNKIVKQADKITNSTSNRKVAEKPTQMIYE